MSTSPEQQLLYQLRSPTLPLDDKLQLIATALDTESSNSLAQLVRDWMVDLLLKSRQQHPEIILSAPCWTLLARACLLSPSISSSPSLPVFVAFVQAYPTSGKANADLVNAVSTSWSKLASSAMRKATVDAALSGTAALLTASAQVLQRNDDASLAWQGLIVVWLRAFRGVLDLGKAGKKVPQQILAQLPSILSLFFVLDEQSPARQSLLDTVKPALFNVENLRRGIARESYHAGSADATSIMSIRDDGGEGAAGELLNALESYIGEEALIHASVPVFTSLYFSALADHATTLFPLPAKHSNFPTASAARSALEIHSLQKRRALAASWTRGVATLVGWQQEEDDYQKDLAIDAAAMSSSNAKSSADLSDPRRAQALASVLQAVEADDLHRDGALEGWSGTLEFLAGFALTRLEAATTPDARESLLTVLASILRLSFRSLDTYVPRLLASLAITAATPASPASAVLLGDLLNHHERSVTLPTLLHQLSTALAGAAHVVTSSNSLLTSHAFFTVKLERAIGSMGSAGTLAAQSCFDSLVRAAGLQGSENAVAITVNGSTADGVDTVDDDSRSTKRRKVSPEPASTTFEPEALGARLRVLVAFVRGVPSSVLPVASFERLQRNGARPALQTFANAILARKDSSIKSKGKGKIKSSGTGWDAALPEWLELSFAMRSRVVNAGMGSSSEWKLDGDMGRRLHEALKYIEDDGHIRVAIMQTLLQAIENDDFFNDPSVSQVILDSVLDVCAGASMNSASWNGLLRGIGKTQVPTAMWETVTRRWMSVMSRFATPIQLEKLAALITSTLNGDAVNALIPSGSTVRMLRRADIYELPNLQAPLKAAIVSLVSLPELTSPEATLAHVQAARPPKSLTSLDGDKLGTTINAFSRVTSLVPLEYLGKQLRADLVDRGLSIDLWLSSAHASQQEVASSQSLVLRQFVVVVLGSSQGLTASAEVLAALLQQTSDEAVNTTLELYRRYIRSMVQSYKSDKNALALTKYLEAFSKPFSALSRRFRQGVTSLTCEEQALSILYESLALDLGPASELPTVLSDAIRSSVKSATKSFDKAVISAQGALESDNAVAFEFAGLLNACKAMWLVKAWLGDAQDASQNYASFAEAVLSATLRRLRLRMLPPPQALTTSLALLDLLRLRMDQMRAHSSEEVTINAPFEAFVACHVSLGSSLASIAVASKALETNLKQATTCSSTSEYAAALSSLSEAISSAVGVDEYSAGGVSASLAPTLRVALVVLRDGPEGSSRLGGAFLSDALRHLTVVLSRYGSRHVEHDGEAVARLYLQVSQFVESICSDKPMLLSRLNVSSVLSMVSRMLQPMGTTAAASSNPVSATPPDVASRLFMSLVSIVSHLVQHRKDHISPLFANLVAALAGLIGPLRRGGYGTTGSGSVDEDGDLAIGLGKRAEREARATFPFWVWEGGSQCISHVEGKAVGRLLGSLAAKTTSNLKRKHGAGSRSTTDGPKTISLVAPLSKHAPFIILPYLRACAHPTCPIPSTVRKELQGGWFEVMDAMGKWERESLMTAFLGSSEETERAVLRAMWKGWEKERYKGN